MEIRFSEKKKKKVKKYKKLPPSILFNQKRNVFRKMY